MTSQEHNTYTPCNFSLHPKVLLFKSDDTRCAMMQTYRFVYAAPLFKSNTGSVSWHFTPFPRNLCLSQLPCAKDSPWDPWDPHQRSAAPGVPGLRLSWWARRRTLPSPTHTGFSLFYTSLHCLPLCLLVGKLFRCHQATDTVTSITLMCTLKHLKKLLNYYIAITTFWCQLVV